jgi:hypothetical protein
MVSVANIRSLNGHAVPSLKTRRMSNGRGKRKKLWKASWDLGLGLLFAFAESGEMIPESKSRRVPKQIITSGSSKTLPTSFVGTRAKMHVFG